VLAEALDARGSSIGWAHGWGEACSRDAGPVAVKLTEWKKDYRPFAMMLSNVGDPVTMHVEASIIRGEDDRYLRRKHELRPPYPKEVRFELPPAILSEQTSLAYRIELYTTSPYDWKGGPIERTVLAQRMAPTPTPPDTIALDLGPGMLPRVTQPALETTTEPARPFVSFRVPSREGSDAATIDADAAIVRLTWPRTREHSWTLVLSPNGPRRVRLPALPDALAQWRPDGRDTSVSVGLVDASAYASFVDVKKKGLAPLAELDEGATLRWAIAGDQDF
jgi:hypothetical protein